MKYRNDINRISKFIIAFCLVAILQLSIPNAYGQELSKTLNDDYLYKGNDFNPFNGHFPNAGEETPTLQAPPEGETDPEIIGIDKLFPINDALPFLLILSGMYGILLFRKMERRKQKKI